MNFQIIIGYFLRESSMTKTANDPKIIYFVLYKYTSFNLFFGVSNDDGHCDRL